MFLRLFRQFAVLLFSGNSTSRHLTKVIKANTAVDDRHIHNIIMHYVHIYAYRYSLITLRYLAAVCGTSSLMTRFDFMYLSGSFTFFYLLPALQFCFKTRSLLLLEFIPEQEVAMKLLVSIVCCV